MTTIPDWAVAFWLVASVFCAVVALYAGVRFWRLRTLTDEWAEENAEMRSILEFQAQKLSHRCYPPTWSPRLAGAEGWVPVKIGTHHRCMCGVTYVLIRRFRARPDGPFRLGWVTTTEARTGQQPAWDRQPDENRLTGPSPISAADLFPPAAGSAL